MKKLFSVKSITRLLYGIVMLFPMFSILSRVIYVQANQEAYRSYSQYSNTQLINGNSSNVIVGNTLYLSYTNEQGSYAYSPQYIFSYSSVDFRAFNDLITYIPDGVQFYSNSNLRLRNSSTLEWSSYANIWGLELFNLSLILKESLPNYFAGGNLRVQVIYNSVGTLDNAFEYSVDSFVKDNNIGNLDFFSWFSDLFLSNNSVNLLYINFINWYLNYALLVSLGYILFLCLMWFVNVARRILDKGEKFGEGDY